MTTRRRSASRRSVSRRRRKGYHLSAQARRNMSAARKGKRHPHRGHPLSTATRAKISAALKRRHGTSTVAKKSPKAKSARKAPTVGKARKATAKRPAGVRRLKRATTPATSRSGFRSHLRRTKVGARRGFFRHEQRVSARRHHWMRVSNKPLVHRTRARGRRRR